MAASDADTTLAVEYSGPVSSSDATAAIVEAFSGLKLEVKSEPEDAGDPNLEKKPEEESGGGSQEVVADGWGSDREAPAAPAEVAVVADGWGSDPEPESEVKADGWGWDQDYNKGFDSTDGEKGEVFGWGQDAGGDGESSKFEAFKGEKTQRNRSPPLPVRPNQPDCAFYLKTGACKFGQACKFNHPPSKLRNKPRFRKPGESPQAGELNGNGMSSEMVGQIQHEKTYKDKKRGTPSEINGQMDCKYYSMPGGCKYGSACKYNHKENTDAPPALNFLGLPMRPGEKECTYYMSTGSCKFSTNCRFHHPDPIAVGGQNPSGYQNGAPSQPQVAPAHLPIASWPLQQPLNEPAPFLDPAPPYVPTYFLPPQGLHPNPEWNGYQAPMNPLFPPSGMQDAMRKGNGIAPITVPDGDYPERPGQPECHFFMRTGTCKFKSACRFHHPKSRLPKTPSPVPVSPVGLPLRPDQPVCTHYSRHGICKFGQSCRYNHPMDGNTPATPNAGAESANTTVESQEIKTESSANPVAVSEW